MEEKNKNIIYSIIAILLGIIVGGCTQVKAQTNELLTFQSSFKVYVRTNENYAYVDNYLEYPINIDNTSYQGADTNIGNIIYNYMNENDVIKIRMCNIGASDNIIPISIADMGYYGKPLEVKVYYTSTECNWTEPWEGGQTHTGKETEIQIKTSQYNGWQSYIDLDTGKSQLQYQVQINMIASSTGIVSKIRYVFSNNMNVPEDAIATESEILKNIQNILNQGNFNKPTKDEILSDYEDKEEELWEIIGVPNYNNLNIDIDANTNSKIWNLIVYILNQNTAILTMVITILSISILKLILNR